MSSRPDCIFGIHQLCQSGFSRVYYNSCCIRSFAPEIIKIGQSSHNMYSSNILNFQESMTILNACTKNVWTLIESTTYVFCEVHSLEFYFLHMVLSYTIIFYINLFDPKQALLLRSRVGLEVIRMKCYSKLHSAPEVEPRNQIEFSVISRRHCFIGSLISLLGMLSVYSKPLRLWCGSIFWKLVKKQTLYNIKGVESRIRIFIGGNRHGDPSSKTGRGC